MNGFARRCTQHLPSLCKLPPNGRLLSTDLSIWSCLPLGVAFHHCHCSFHTSTYSISQIITFEPSSGLKAYSTIPISTALFLPPRNSFSYKEKLRKNAYPIFLRSFYYSFISHSMSPALPINLQIMICVHLQKSAAPPRFLLAARSLGL